jgi:hypothetical protein
MPYNLFRWLSNALVRARLDLPTSNPFQITIADTAKDKKAAMRLCYQCYRKKGIIPANDMRMHFTPWHKSGNAITLIAKDGKRVIGTLSIILKNKFGVPMNRMFKLCEIEHFDFAEIGCLAIDKKYRQKGRVLFPLTRLMWIICYFKLRLHFILITVHPKHIKLYKRIYLFRDIPGEKMAKNFTPTGKPGVAMYLNIPMSLSRYYAVYGKRDKKTNLYKYFSSL